jgi:hypothetical protein
MEHTTTPDSNTARWASHRGRLFFGQLSCFHFENDNKLLLQICSVWNTFATKHDLSG